MVGRDLFRDFRGGTRANFASVAQDRNTIADLHHFMQFMGNKDQPMTVLHHLVHDDE